MNNKSVSIKNISKEYVVGNFNQNRFGNVSMFKRHNEKFLALDNISFDINKGEIIGIIGKNGAGKSTLLKVLSKITKPTRGTIVIEGRVSSLLEVGTGFHPELTGRENIFLNGTILGMTRDEVKTKFKEIVKFSGVENFIDTPVKHYSSGMYVRLAFSVAAHLDPDILIIDEVLAVGDIEFQEKCLGKMKDVSGDNRTVIFVSHNLDALRNLCDSGVLIENGKLKFKGNIDEVIGKYLDNNKLKENTNYSLINHEKNEILLKEVELKLQKNGNLNRITNEDDIEIIFHYHLYKDFKFLRALVTITNQNGTVVLTTSDIDLYKKTRKKGNYLSRLVINKRLLNIGKYTISIRFDSPKLKVFMATINCLSFTVNEVLFHQLGQIADGEPKGVIHTNLKWEKITSK